MPDFLNGFQLVICDHPRLEKSLGHLVDQDGHISNGQTEAFYQFCNRHGPAPLLFRLLRPHYVVRKAILLGDVPERLTVRSDTAEKNFTELLEEGKPSRERGARRHRQAEPVKGHEGITVGKHLIAQRPDLCSSLRIGIGLRKGKPLVKAVPDPRLNVLSPRAFDHPRYRLISGLAVFTRLFLNVRIKYDNCLVPLVGHSKCGRSFR